MDGEEGYNAISTGKIVDQATGGEVMVIVSTIVTCPCMFVLPMDDNKGTYMHSARACASRARLSPCTTTGCATGKVCIMHGKCSVLSVPQPQRSMGAHFYIVMQQ
jgi:hypothetical protein